MERNQLMMIQVSEDIVAGRMSLNRPEDVQNGQTGINQARVLPGE